MSNEKRFQEESSYLDFTLINIDLREKEISELIANPGGATPASGYHVKRRLQAIELPDRKSPYFTRVDLVNGETLYYGFGMLTQASKSPPVPESHPGVSMWLTYHIDTDSKGYRALPLADLPDVARRVRLVIKKGELVEITREETNDGFANQDTSGVLAAELLTASMTETRGESLEAVGSTLQPDQFRVSRAPNDTILAVQGPPGSGKTVVLLERLSRIAFKDPTARDKGLVLIGPNRKFLEYVEDALATLGKSDVITSTVEDLTKWKYVEKPEDDVVEVLKARRVMEDIINDLVLDIPQLLDTNYDFKIADINVEFTVNDSYELIATFREDDSNYDLIRERAAKTVLGILTERFFLKWEDGGRDRSRFDRDPQALIQQTSNFKTLMRNMYPEITPESLLKKLKKSPNEFIKYATRYLEFEDVQNWLQYVVPEPFEIRCSDVPLLDYIEFSLRGKQGTAWGHIAIDEAQNLTPMQLRMLARRLDNPSAVSLTGDLAQGIGAIYYEQWDDIAEHFDSDHECYKAELTKSYRVPKDVIEYSLKFLKKAEVNVEAAEPFLDIPNALNLEIQPRENHLLHAEGIARKHLENKESVLVVAPEEFREKAKTWKLKPSGSAHLKIYAPTEVKGLEFDVVIVVDPVGILNELNYEIGRSARLMYVNVTRSTKKLYMVGQSKEQLEDPVKYYENLSYQNYEEALLGQLSDFVPELESEDLQDEFELNFDNPTSIPSLCREFRIELSTVDNNHNSSGWKYRGFTQSRCIECGSKPQMFFTKNSEVKVTHKALVCTRCEVIRGEDFYESSTMDAILKELESRGN